MNKDSAVDSFTAASVAAVVAVIVVGVPVITSDGTGYNVQSTI